jgi:BirA family biotin operon repressor/biotin-[acetyl-CoA-carboxylase] ligase
VRGNTQDLRGMVFSMKPETRESDDADWVEKLRNARKGNLIGREILYFERVDSTNRLGRELGRQGEKEGLVILAESQSQGKGRRGRVWESPSGVNLYISIILKPSLSPAVAQKITLLTGVAVANALTKTSGLEAKIKWPNDIFIHGKKAAGILAEMETEGSTIRFIVLGVGVNVNWKMEDVSPDLQALATSLQAETGKTFSRAQVASDILMELEKEYKLFLGEGFSPRLREEWNRLSWINEKWVRIQAIDQEFEGRVLGVDGEGALLLMDRKGEEQRFIAGDVSLRY